MRGPVAAGAGRIREAIRGGGAADVAGAACVVFVQFRSAVERRRGAKPLSVSLCTSGKWTSQMWDEEGMGSRGAAGGSPGVCGAWAPIAPGARGERPVRWPPSACGPRLHEGQARACMWTRTRGAQRGSVSSRLTVAPPERSVTQQVRIPPAEVSGQTIVPC